MSNFVELLEMLAIPAGVLLVCRRLNLRDDDQRGDLTAESGTPFPPR